MHIISINIRKSICIRGIATPPQKKLKCYPQQLPKPHLTCVPEPSGTWPGYVHRNPPQPDLTSAPGPSAGTFRNLT